jgi:hypothetical protein
MNQDLHQSLKKEKKRKNLTKAEILISPKSQRNLLPLKVIETHWLSKLIDKASLFLIHFSIINLLIIYGGPASGNQGLLKDELSIVNLKNSKH